MKKITTLALAVMFLAACSKDNEITPGTTGSNNSTSGTQKSQVARSFSATLNATADTDPSIPPTSCSGDLPGFSAPDFLISGTSIHMGSINLQSSRLHHNSCDLSFTTALLTTNVSGQLSAANGDLIYYSGNDVVNVFSLLTQTGTTGDITGVWTITGGTGRFAGASGSLTINGVVDFATNSFSCECVGTINY